MPDETIHVHVIDYGRKSLYMRYRDPITGKHIARSTGTQSKKEAVRIAAKWEGELQAGRYKAPSKVAWDEFRELYVAQAVPAMADTSFGKINSVFNSVEQFIGVKLLRDLDAAKVMLWQSKLRNDGRSESTIGSYSGTLRAMLNWAHSQGLLPDVPKVRMPKRARKSDERTPMKGRPITTEEFERMLAKTADVVGDERAESWNHLLRGLWLSGLRINEAHRLSWDGDKLAVDLTGEHPMLRIDADHEKGNRDRFLPIAPELGEFLLATPEDERDGHVFRPLPERYRHRRPTLDCMKKIIGKIGEAAGVKVLEGKYRGEAHTKYASAQDLRRAFGSRWATRVMPTVLQKLMRHERIETTLRHFVGLDAQETTRLLYAAVSEGNTLGNTSENRATSPRVTSAEPLGK